MKIVATSDLHGYLPPIPPCDLLLICGDVCPLHHQYDTAQRTWLRSEFVPRVEYSRRNAGFRECVMTWGNHDLIGHKWLPHSLKESCRVLLDEMFEFEGLKIWGDPWTSWCGEWAFMLHPEQLAEKHRAIPAVDIIVTHGPPYGFGDLCPRLDRRGSQTEWEHIGSPALMQRIVDTEPKLVVFGHNHHGQGNRKLGETVIANVALVGPNMAPSYPPMEFEL